MIRCVQIEDAEQLAQIYNFYVLNTTVTFETEALSTDAMAQRITENLTLSLPWLVAVIDEKIAGYCYASKWKGRCAYQYSVEITIYLDSGYHGRGLGYLLYQQLFQDLKLSGFHVAIAGIALPNPESIALHEKLGMQKVAHFREVGFKSERWIDVGYWQCLLN